MASKIDQPIAALLNGGKPRLSLEFFPPKTPEAEKSLIKTAEAIAKEISPDFVSITYGAGGSTREKTFAYTQYLRNTFGWTVMPHLTCVGHSRDELLAIAESYARLGVRNIMALRGDPPKNVANFTPHPQGLSYASELVGLLKKELPELCVGVAGYPEKHPEAPDLATDLDNLAHKVSRGANFITTQLFFETSTYLRFVDECRKRSLRLPILPGLLPVTSLEQARRFCGFCGATLPGNLVERLKAASEEEQWKVGADWTFHQLQLLIESGDALGIHLYIMNRSESVLRLIHKIREEKLFGQ